jgi:hypothetical protein
MNRATNLSPSNLQAQPHCNQWNIKNGSTPIQITLLDYVRIISLLSIISAAQQQRISLTRSDSRTSRGDATLVISADSLKKFEEELLDLNDIN